ncbi:hypothetical protein Misp01_83110 [Microtetraspora sp. NBRC 13810]|uniref:4'-phosphopantetheinyl transferase family protein n=1 Tax=Microtetraspora sp. NBRC 13810 TaxID=3030990 RepID=UPI0024A4D578|nr:4'-phosphopantetheinyl transferase superfamily protein [Microtetraspora sp. NBRC 13810]GLW13183.1 hypothetical protein Misp01_83110 [Microtetraspora sp. NBRC 13810]
MPDPVALAGATAELWSPREQRSLYALLTRAECERAARFVRETDRRDYVAAHVLVRHCAAEVLGRPPEKLTLLQRCERCGPGHGKPYLAEAPEIGVSLSHTHGYVCAAAGPGRVGIDAEHVPPGPLDEGLAGQALTAAERAAVTCNRGLIRQWVRKEALVKRGELTLADLRSLDLSALTLKESPVPRAFTWEGRHLLEWAHGDVLGTVISDRPGRLSHAFAP